MLTRATWTSGTLFLVLALVLSIMSSRAAGPQSVIQVAPAGATEPEPFNLGQPVDAPAPVETPATEPPAN